jgi:REP element-mobilizing transposase RayT
VAEVNTARVLSEERRMVHPAFVLDAEARGLVLASIRETCAWRGWRLLTAHVRTEHVHVVVEAEVAAEEVVRDLKAYASRRLNAQGPVRERRWTRRASSVALASGAAVRAAVRYVVEKQGAAMAVFLAEELGG